nr:hypothetical protein [Lysinibacillus timonensis]
MRKRFTRIFVFVIIVLVLAFLINQYFIHFDGDGKRTPEEALPTDQNYVWIEGSQSEDEYRYFFLSDGHYVGTNKVTKNLSGWSLSEGHFGKIPNPLEENKIIAAYSDHQILYGLIKPKGQIHITVNEEAVELVDLTSVSEEILKLYGVSGYSIWYIDLSKLEDTDQFVIEIRDSNNNLLNELTI